MLARILAFLCMFYAGIAVAVPLDTFHTFATNNPNEAKTGPVAELLARGIGTNSFYVLEVDPTTGALPVSLSGGGGLGYDTNYGTVGANTLRTAAQIGNATGAAAFGQGAVTAQTLRSVSILSNGTTGLDYGSGASSSATLRTILAADQGTLSENLVKVNGTTISLGQTTMASSFPVTIASNQTAVPISAASLPLPTGAATQVTLQDVDDNLALINDTLTNAVVPNQTGGYQFTKITDGNLTHIAQVNGVTGALLVDGSTATQPISGTVTANAGTNLNTSALTLDATSAKLNLAQGSTTASQTGPLVQGAVTTSAPSYTDGKTNPLSLTTSGALRVDGSGSSQPVSGTVAATQSGPWTVTANAGTGNFTVVQTTGSNLHVSADNLPTTADTNYGTPGSSTVRTAAMLGVGSTAVSTSNPVPQRKIGGAFSDSKYLDMSSTNVTTGAWVQLIASTAGAFNFFKIATTCASTLELGTGGGGSEVRVLLIPPGGYDSDVNLAIAASTRISVRAVSTAGCTSGELNLTGFN